jgi:hypothetical protein
MDTVIRTFAPDYVKVSGCQGVRKNDSLSPCDPDTLVLDESPADRLGDRMRPVNRSQFLEDDL